MTLTYNDHRVLPLKVGSTKHQYAFDVPKSRFLERVVVKKPTYYRPIASRKTKLLAYVARLAKLTDRTRAKKHMSQGRDAPPEPHSHFANAVHAALSKHGGYKSSKGKYGKAYHHVKQDALSTRSYTRNKVQTYETPRSPPSPPPMPPARSSTPYRRSSPPSASSSPSSSQETNDALDFNFMTSALQPRTSTLLSQGNALISQSKEARRAEKAKEKEERRKRKAHAMAAMKAAHRAGRK